MVQIAGLIARRIVCEISKDQDLKQGNRIGMIRFGSRADVYFANYTPLVKSKSKNNRRRNIIKQKDSLWNNQKIILRLCLIKSKNDFTKRSYFDWSLYWT